MKAFQFRSLPVAALLCAAGLAACKKPQTYVHVQVQPAAGGEPAPITDLELDLDLAGRTTSVHLTNPDRSAIALPSDVTLEVKTGSGQMAIVAIAKNAAGAEVDRATGTVQVGTGAITEATIQLPGGKADLQPVENQHDFGAVALGASGGPITATFANHGFRTTATLTATLGGVGAANWTIAADTCTGSSVAGQGSCTVQMTFAPVTAGPLAATLTVGGASIALTGVGNSNPQLLTIAFSGTGGGTVSSTPAGIACSTSPCGHSFEWGTAVTLTAAPAAASHFVRWVGGCSGSGASCVVNLIAAKQIAAVFDHDPVTLTLAFSGNGGGSVSDGTNSCSAACTLMEPYGQPLTLTATADAASVLGPVAGLTCDSNPTALSCLINSPTADLSGSFVFTATQVAVGVTGSGTVVSGESPAAINCPGTCSSGYNTGASVTLAASAATGSTFNRWSGACTGSTNPCVVTASGQTNVTAAFNYDLTVTKTGSGSGSVTCTVAGITGQCAANYPPGTSVKLTAAAASDSVFGGWSGGSPACSGIGTCTVTMSQAQSITAPFQQIVLTVSPNGDGNIKTADGKINCGNGGTTCSAAYNAGSAVSLNATAVASSSTFVAWNGGGCATANPCNFTISAPTAVTGSFDYLFNVSKGGAGSGSVLCLVGSTLGACASSYPPGTAVVVEARPSNGSNSLFGGFSGGTCSGLAHDCAVTVNGPVSVNAAFNSNPNNVMFISSSTVAANLGGARAYDQKCNQLATAAGINNAAANAFIAWMSDANSSAGSLIANSRGFVRMDGAPVVDLPSDLFAGKILNAVSYLETGAQPPSGQLVFTGTNADGTAALYLPAGSTVTTGQCRNWTTTLNTENASGGEAYGGPNQWTAWWGGGCQFVVPLLCVETDKNVALATTASTGKLIYVATFTLTAGGGITAANNACASTKPATAGTVVALLPTTATPASSVLKPSQLYVRPDGQPVGLGSEIAAGTVRSGIWQSGTGSYSSGSVWTGTTTPASPGTISGTCNNWTDPTSTTKVEIGVAPIADSNFWAWLAVGTCNQTQNVYCVEQ